MAINKNHEFEELNGVKCAIVEKNASHERADFLKGILEVNNYSVVVVPSAPPKAASAPVTPAPATGADGVPATATPPLHPPPPAPTTFTIGVTDVTFNPTNAIFGRLLRSKDGKVVTLAYWQQKEEVPNDAVPYYEKK